MPGARSATFRFGDSAELLAEYLVAKLAFVTRVPRQEDVGHDLLCALIEKDGQMLKAGPFFVLQVKANHKPIVFQKDYELSWLSNQENPFFLGVVELSSQSLHVYSTWQIIRLFLWVEVRKVTLYMQAPPAGKDDIDHDSNTKEAHVYLGLPIVVLRADETNDEKITAERAEVLKSWVDQGRENIARKASKMYWVLAPINYATNKVPVGVTVFFFWNRDNIDGNFDNFVRSSVALLAVMKDIGQTKLTPDQWKLYGELRVLMQTQKALDGHMATKLLEKYQL